MIKKIALIETHTDLPNIYSFIFGQRLGLPVIARILKDEGFEVDIYCNRILRPTIRELCEYDLVGLSCLTNTSTEGFRIADSLRKENRLVIMGGPHVTFMPEEGLKHCDIVVRREGEETLLELISAINSGAALEGIRGISYRKNGSICHNEDREFSERYLKTSPDYSLVKGIEKFKKGHITRYLYYQGVYTSRGCPHNCRYCTVIKIAGNRMRYRDLDDVIEDIRMVVKDIQVEKSVGIGDDNFTHDMPRTKEFLRKIINARFPPHIHFTVQLKVDSFKDDEFLQLLKKASFAQLHVGYESINEKTLKDWKKRQSFEEIKFSVSQAHKYELKMNGMFVVGSDEDTIDTIRDTASFSIESGLTTMQMWILTPLPGSDVYRQVSEENRIFNIDWKYFDCQHSVFFPRLMKPSTLQRGLVEANRKFYTYRRMFHNAIGNRITFGTAAFFMDKSLREYEKKLKRIEDEFYTKDGTLIEEKLKNVNPPQATKTLFRHR